jgi:hypothetical protein
MLALLFLGSAAAMIAQDTGSSKPYWVLSQTNPKTHDVSHAWLVLPPFPGDSARLTLVDGSTLDAWFADSLGACGSTKEQEHKVPPATGQRVVPVCIEPQATETTRLLAQIETWRSAGARTTYVAPSDTIASRNRRSLSPTALALISAVIGLIAGGLTQVVQIVLSSRTKAAETKASIHDQLTKHLLPEMTTHSELIRLHKASTRLDESLPMEAYQRLEDDEGILGFLDTEERKGYLESLRTYYATIESYNVALDNKDVAGAAKLRPAILSRLTTYIGKGD